MLTSFGGIKHASKLSLQKTTDRVLIKRTHNLLSRRLFRLRNFLHKQIHCKSLFLERGIFHVYTSVHASIGSHVIVYTRMRLRVRVYIHEQRNSTLRRFTDVSHPSRADVTF